MQKHWNAALEVLAEYSVDLYSPPLGELWIAAARIGQTGRLAPQIEQAFGRLPRWVIQPRGRCHCIGRESMRDLVQRPAAVAPHGQALTAAAGRSSFKALSGAGRTWLRVLADQVDPDEVTTAARALAQFGLTSDATRLASQAALQTPDAKVRR